MSEPKKTPRQEMNLWVATNIEVIRDIINTTGSQGKSSEFLLGVETGIRMLQSAWLDGKFDGIET